jgi:formate hydrogenlyase subunit 3/multisubunit Na+/H+ antiporter MnhD subunit
MSLLLALTLGVPLGLLLLLTVKPWQPYTIRLLALAPLPGLMLALASAGGAEFSLRLSGGSSFALDRTGAMLLGASALIWCAAGACASAWLRDKPGAAPFAMWWLLTLTGSLGVFAAADLASFYLLYAAASLPAYGLLVWNGGGAERRAGKLTLAAALLGEALLLAAFVLLAVASPGQSLLISDGVAALAASPYRDAVIGLLILGFGLKIGLVPLHAWMPLSYAAGPLFAAAALSGATSKAGIIGLIRFLPFDTGLHSWGMALLAAGLFSGFYGVAVGLLQRNPRMVLAYSSISQLGQMAAALGAGLALGNAQAMVLVGFYALYHVLVKGGLFLAIAARPQASRLVLITAGLAALGFAGLPLTGGALAKLAVKPLIGDGAAGVLFAIAAIGSTLLMLHFIRLIREVAPSPDARAGTSSTQLVWIALFAVAMLLPWLLFPGVTGLAPGYALTPAVLLDLAWPVAAGVLIGLGLGAMGLLPPQRGTGTAEITGEPGLKLWDAAAQAVSWCTAHLAGLEHVFRRWSVSTSVLVLTLLVFTVLLALGGA